MAVGIVSYGAYVPRARVGLAALAGGARREGGPERAVAWHDEDCVTMAVAAGGNCLRGFDRESLDGLFFASTTHPYQEKQSAALIAAALDLRRDMRTLDVSGTLRAGCDALRAALDAVAAGTARRVLVVASDCRLGAPGSTLERNFGDGAAALLVGGENTVAELRGHYAFADEIVNVWRGGGERFVHAWEERFVLQEGTAPGIAEAVRGLLQKLGAGQGAQVRAGSAQGVAGGADPAQGAASGFDPAQSDAALRVALAAPDARSHAQAARKLGAAAESLVDPLFGRLGNAGAAFAPLLLVSALERAAPGERILLAGYGDGGCAMGFEATELAAKLEARRGVDWHLERRRAADYQRYRRARELEIPEYEAGASPGLSATVHFRERDSDIGFKAQKCRACGALQFPPQRVCESCFAKDDFELRRISDRTGRLVTWTLDYFYPTPEPPTAVGVVDIEGARVHMQLVNLAAEDLRSGLPLDFHFRCMHRVGGRPNYYWKAAPAGE